MICNLVHSLCPVHVYIVICLRMLMVALCLLLYTFSYRNTYWETAAFHASKALPSEFFMCMRWQKRVLTKTRADKTQRKESLHGEMCGKQVLQGKVMVYVNQIAEIVHAMIDEFLGFPNKNLGDAYASVPDSWRRKACRRNNFEGFVDWFVLCSTLLKPTAMAKLCWKSWNT